MELEEAVDEAMEKIRDNHFLTDEVPRAESIEYLMQVAERCHELAGEIAGEGIKAARRVKATG